MASVLYLFHIVNLLYKGEERQGCDIHIIYNLGLAGEAYLKLTVALDSVNGSARTAESVTTAAAADKLISGIFHRAHDSKV